MVVKCLLLRKLTSISGCDVRVHDSVALGAGSGGYELRLAVFDRHLLLLARQERLRRPEPLLLLRNCGCDNRRVLMWKRRRMLTDLLLVR